MKDIMIPVVIDGEKVGELPLATEYRILLDLMVLTAEADIAHIKSKLAELDELSQPAPKRKIG